MSHHDSASPPELPDVTPWEDGFWEERGCLTAIYESALGRRCSPWAVLATCAALALTTIPPEVRLPNQGSLNWFAGLVAPSGFGKGEGVKCAQELMPKVATEIRGTPSSGEGLRDLFLPDEAGVRRKAVLINEAEVDTIDGTGRRTGSTVWPTMRKAWEGALIDFVTRGTAKPEMTVPAQSYRMCFLCGVQPGRGAALVEDAAGTAQRFLWVPAVDRRANGEAKRKYRNVSHQLALPKATAWKYFDNPKNHILVPDAIGSEIDDEHDLKSNIFWQGGELDSLDTHEMFLRLKTSVALAVLDGRTNMTLDDWGLSRTVIDVSKLTRQWVIDSIERDRASKASRKGREDGLRQHAAAETRTVTSAEALDRTIAWVRGKLAGAVNTANGGLNRTELNQAANSTRKAYLGEALNYMTNCTPPMATFDGNDPLARGVRFRLAVGNT